jgi:hypothetical protein
MTIDLALDCGNTAQVVAVAVWTLMQALYDAARLLILAEIAFEPVRYTLNRPYLSVRFPRA